ncbi:hypothetical protein FACS1894190_14530 [Spirochaetia bacterium]|nr:hypothetical protein FACS1894190_14530 [Spirochaetia bacterium]
MIAALLDGHSSVFAMPWHDKLADLFLSHDFDKNIAVQMGGQAYLIYILMKLYSDTGWPELQTSSMQNELVVPVKHDYSARIHIEFDFHKLENKIIRQAKNIIDLNPSNFINMVFENLLEVFKPEIKSSCKYYLSMARNGFRDFDAFFTTYPYSKILYARRPFVDWYYAFCFRAAHGDHSKMSGMIPYLAAYDGRMGNLLWLEKNIDRLQSQYPDRLKIIEFEDLITSHKEVMKNVAAFLGINYENVMYNTTALGVPIDLVGEIKDKVGEIITSNEKALIEQVVTSLPPPPPPPPPKA